MTTNVLGDTGALTGRSLRHILRSPDTIITTAVTPIAMLLLFVYVLGGAIHTGSGQSYVNYLLPGILLITIASGIAYTAYRLFLDLQGGIFERFQSMPIARSSVLWAHVLTSLVANLVSVAVVTGVALIMGFRTGASAGSWLAGARPDLLRRIQRDNATGISGDRYVHTIDGIRDGIHHAVADCRRPTGQGGARF